ncbi:MAG: cell division FtsA domain-containing protein [Candidatus Omnitrophota bacterium]
MNREIFALDIGTRKVMGIVACKNGESLDILDVEVIEHTTRPMLDGQIHNIEEVAKTVRQIKENLESRQNKQFNQAGVAVAGRNLVTYKTRIIKEFNFQQEVTADIVRNLELEAVDKIISDSRDNLGQFYCVGYSPVYYELDGNKISDLTGHRANTIACELIVTFLPRVVLDSMFSVLKRSGLEAVNITLEPISAINAIVPQDMRNLNICLVDIGAGTSDLALTRDKVVFAYGMVPEAGDEITECISEKLLVDFSTAEQIKRMLGKKEEIEYMDIWARPRRIDALSLKAVISEVVKKLAGSIANSAIELNGGVPQAVVVVGGGGLTFNLIEELSAGMGSSLDNVGIRLPSAIRGINDMTGKLTGPEAVTPIGIALMTADSLGLRFINIELILQSRKDEQPVIKDTDSLSMGDSGSEGNSIVSSEGMTNTMKLRMLDFQQKKDVLGALTFSGIINKKKLYPRLGLALTVKVNQELKIIKGTMGEPAEILLNGSPVSSLSQKIEDGDKIEFQEAVNGQDAHALIKDLLEIKPMRVVFNQEDVQFIPSVVMNGEEVNLDREVFDRADIRIFPPKIKDVLKFKEIKLEDLSERQILVNINGVPKILTQASFTLRLNGNISGIDTEVKENDIIEFSPAPTFYRVEDIVDIPLNYDKMAVNVNGRDIEIEIEPVQIFMNGRRVSPKEFLIDGAEIKIYYLKERHMLLSEIFRYIDIDPRKAVGKRMKILVNDLPAGFTTQLTEGSKVEIVFEERIAAA